MWAQEILLWSLCKKEFINVPHFIHLFSPVLQYPLKEQIHLRMFILSWYYGLKSFSICFCPALDITFCRWQHLSDPTADYLLALCLRKWAAFPATGTSLKWVEQHRGKSDPSSQVLPEVSSCTLGTTAVSWLTCLM